MDNFYFPQLSWRPGILKCCASCRAQGAGSLCPAALLRDLLCLKQVASPEEPAWAPCSSQEWNPAHGTALSLPGPSVSPVPRQALSQSLPCLAGLSSCCSAGRDSELCLAAGAGTLWCACSEPTSEEEFKVFTPYSGQYSSSGLFLCVHCFPLLLSHPFWHSFSSHSRRWQGSSWPWC